MASRGDSVNKEYLSCFPRDSFKVGRMQAVFSLG